MSEKIVDIRLSESQLKLLIESLEFRISDYPIKYEQLRLYSDLKEYLKWSSKG